MRRLLAELELGGVTLAELSRRTWNAGSAGCSALRDAIAAMGAEGVDLAGAGDRAGDQAGSQSGSQ